MAHSDNLHQHWPSLLSIQVVYLGSLPNNKRELCSRWIVGRWAALFKYLNSKWNKAVIWHTDENLMIPLESSFMFKLERLYYFISKLEMTLSLCDNEITHGARNTLFCLISLEFYIGLSSSLWLWETVKKHLVIQTELQRSLDLLFQNQKSNINPIFFSETKNAQKYSRQLLSKLQIPEWTSMLHKQFRGPDRGYSRGEGISKEREEKNWFPVHPVGVSQDSPIACLCAAADNSQAADGLGFKCRSFLFEVSFMWHFTKSVH